MQCFYLRKLRETHTLRTVQLTGIFLTSRFIRCRVEEVLHAAEAAEPVAIERQTRGGGGGGGGAEENEGNAGALSVVTLPSKC